MHSSIPGLYPLGACSTFHPPSCVNQKFLQELSNSPGGYSYPQLRTTDLYQIKQNKQEKNPQICALRCISMPNILTNSDTLNIVDGMDSFSIFILIFLY